MSQKKKELVVYCGAGVDVDSGIPAFTTGYFATWNKHDVGQVCDYRLWQATENDSVARFPIWNFYRNFQKITQEATPSAFHFYVAKLIRTSPYNVTVVTTNVTDLFERAGVPPEKIIYPHGDNRKIRCCKCGQRTTFSAETPNDVLHNLKCNLNPSCSNTNSFKPDVVFYNEAGGLRYKEGMEAFHKLKSCEDVMIMAGSSGNTFQQINTLWKKKRGRNVQSIQINPDMNVHQEYKAQHQFTSCIEAIESPILRSLLL